VRPKIIFITGTDTGVGKTVLTGLLLSYLRQNGYRALAIKPFCSGDRADAEILCDLQDDELSLDEINPFYFKEPLAPLVAARLHAQEIPLAVALASIHIALANLKTKHSKLKTPPVLLIEGVGGLLAPLGESEFKVQSSRFKVQGSFYTALDLIQALPARVIVVAPNRLGAINHTLLSLHTLQVAGIKPLKAVLMDHLSRNTQPATRTNPAILSELLASVPLVRLPYLGKNPASPRVLKSFARKLKITLAQILP